jgi:carbamoylphosphate synthase large subunit
MPKITTESTSDVHVEAARVQQEIMDYLGLRASDLIFEYSVHEGKTKLDLITINPRHNQSFLFRSESGADKMDALKKMWDYVQNYKEKENSYTIQWVTKTTASSIPPTLEQVTFWMPLKNYIMPATGTQLPCLVL